MTQVSTTSVEEPVILERRGVLGIMVLNRPRALNALTTTMVEIMTEALTAWASDPGIETVAVLGAGDRGLCAGGDVSVFYEDAMNGTAHSETFWRKEYGLNALIASYPKPYVALMDGITLGGGRGLGSWFAPGGDRAHPAGDARGGHRLPTRRGRDLAAIQRPR
ncbi:enoyl-CoA hydratase/isomerase family protein [Nocardioides alcanivorans]|uniref:enoyl-CoA hydratase/isomerase family protein n=1 Tax=Nocardioides alcanivorans TaxID=2897352 RepID=UPI001F3937E2|nr:enoyl-CoA hydratase/isomerase family protein [Nocardioides alcanivorans]